MSGITEQVFTTLLLVLCVTSASARAAAAPQIAPSAAERVCGDTAPDCEAVCNTEPGNVTEACSLQTPIGAYLR